LLELGVFGAVGVVEVWASVGFVVRGLEAGLHAGDAEPADGGFVGVAHFGAAAAGGGFVAGAVATGGFAELRRGGDVAQGGSDGDEDECADGEELADERTGDARVGEGEREEEEPAHEVC
jgi:hypothetical protein